MEKKRFFRVANTENEEGLWYNKSGEFTGLIHNEYNFCLNSNLEMPYDENVLGWLSSTDSMDSLFHWFPLEDIIRLQAYGYRVCVYEATEHREYENHWLINQETSKVIYSFQIGSAD